MARLESVLSVLAAVAVSACVLVGCGGEGGGKAVSVSDVRKTQLAELGDLLKTLSSEGRKPPGKVGELGEHEPVLPTAGPSLRDGEIVYFWGAAHQDGGTAVVAHEKKAPADGGWVLLQDGTVKQMTAAEFAAAPKAGKK